MPKFKLDERLDIEQFEDMDIRLFEKIRRKVDKDEEKEKKERRSKFREQVV